MPASKHRSPPRSKVASKMRTYHEHQNLGRKKRGPHAAVRRAVGLAPPSFRKVFGAGKRGGGCFRPRHPHICSLPPPEHAGKLKLNSARRTVPKKPRAAAPRCFLPGVGPMNTDDHSPPESSDRIGRGLNYNLPILFRFREQPGRLGTWPMLDTMTDWLPKFVYL